MSWWTFTTWLEDRELSVLNKYNFLEEVEEMEIDEDERWILTDLKIKGLLYEYHANGKIYYQGTGSYQQLYEHQKQIKQ